MRRSDKESYRRGPRNPGRRGMQQSLRARGNDENWGEMGRNEGFAERFGRRLGESARNIFGGRDYEYGEHGSQRSTERRGYESQRRYRELRDQDHRDQNMQNVNFGERSQDFFGKGPKGWRRSDERIREDACEALYRSREVDASNIDVSVESGTVILKGSVDDRRTKREAEYVVENLSGVDDVRNEIRVRREGTESEKRAGISNINEVSTTGRSSQLGNSEDRSSKLS